MYSILGLILGCFVASSLARSDPVFTLTDENFDTYLRDKAVMLVDFYAPWCSDCKNLKPHYDKAAREFGKEHKFVFAKMDCFGAGRYTCASRFGIHQWPTLKLFKYGQYQGDYNGPYDEGYIEGYVNNALNDQPEQQQFDQRAANGLWENSQNQYGNACNQYGWTFTNVSPKVCG